MKINRSNFEANIRVLKKTRLLNKKMSGEDLNFKNNSFDIVLSFDVFEHILNINKHFKETKRVLKSNGHYLLQIPTKCFKKHKQYHCFLHSYWKLKKRFKKNGFNVKFYGIPVVNNFFKKKIKKQFGMLELIMPKILNPDYFPYFLKTNFYLVGERV